MSNQPNSGPSSGGEQQSYNDAWEKWESLYKGVQEGDKDEYDVDYEFAQSNTGATPEQDTHDLMQDSEGEDAARLAATLKRIEKRDEKKYYNEQFVKSPGRNINDKTGHRRTFTYKDLHPPINVSIENPDGERTSRDYDLSVVSEYVPMLPGEKSRALEGEDPERAYSSRIMKAYNMAPQLQKREGESQEDYERRSSLKRLKGESAKKYKARMEANAKDYSVLEAVALSMTDKNSKIGEELRNDLVEIEKMRRKPGHYDGYDTDRINAFRKDVIERAIRRQWEAEQAEQTKQRDVKRAELRERLAAKKAEAASQPSDERVEPSEQSGQTEPSSEAANSSAEDILPEIPDTNEDLAIIDKSGMRTKEYEDSKQGKQEKAIEKIFDDKIAELIEATDRAVAKGRISREYANRYLENKLEEFDDAITTIRQDYLDAPKRQELYSRFLGSIKNQAGQIINDQTDQDQTASTSPATSENTDIPDLDDDVPVYDDELNDESALADSYSKYKKEFSESAKEIKAIEDALTERFGESFDTDYATAAKELNDNALRQARQDEISSAQQQELDNKRETELAIAQKLKIEIERKIQELKNKKEALRSVLKNTLGDFRIVDNRIEATGSSATKDQSNDDIDELKASSAAAIDVAFHDETGEEGTNYMNSEKEYDPRDDGQYRKWWGSLSQDGRDGVLGYLESMGKSSKGKALREWLSQNGYPDLAPKTSFFGRRFNNGGSKKPAIKRTRRG